MAKDVDFGSDTYFLNVDLEIVSTADLSVLRKEFGTQVSIHRDDMAEGRFVIWLQLASGPNPSDIDAVIAEFDRLVRQLSTSAREVWNLCEDRVFNMGIQAGTTPNAAVFAVGTKAIELMANLRIRLVTTVYAAVPSARQ